MLELPLPPAIKAYVYVNQATLVEGLIKLAGDSDAEAWDRGRFAAGVAALPVITTGLLLVVGVVAFEVMRRIGIAPATSSRDRERS